ncbi:unnamed protein product [Orchesella dallaii]|uniref:TATA element modulatory factor 1 TATA binding domain-containing protein n=1 Tax=Orchesella dallaii TaxID=48710 RepID=A0ABP1QC30_9HEXA
MSWFQSTNLASFAKTALKEAQKTIDKALDIKEEDGTGNPNGTKNNSAATVGTAVTDMASEFFSSWGVAGVSSNSGSSSFPLEPQNDSDLSSSTSTGAISTSPKRTSVVENLSFNNERFASPNSNSLLSESTNTNRGVFSDVPVTLVSSGDTGQEDRTNEAIKCSSTNKHMRSLSDTVFHSSDNLGDLVQILDDTCATSLIDPAPSTCLRADATSVSSIFDHSSDLGSELKNLHVSKDPSLEEQTPELLIVASKSETDKEERSNLELLQEVDLNVIGGGAEFGKEELLKSNSTYENVISSSIGNAVVESSLSDGWDWTSATDSCLIGFSEQHDMEEEVKENYHPEEDISSEHKLSQDNDDEHENMDVRLHSQLCTLSNSPGITEHNEHELPSQLVVPDNVARDEDTQEQNEHFEPPLIPLSSPVPPSSISSKLISSRLPSAREMDDTTPPSSARVSPNFEMVSSGCAAGSLQPESSRSSSIVVVSGRESTPNSRGSGTGSTGSSEGGHDVEGEIPQSPVAKTTTAAVTVFPKHKKGASSSSSSDIEVIPSDYSSCSASGVPSAISPPKIRERDIVGNNHILTQTDLVEFKDREIQTELEESEDKSSVDPKSLSQYVTSEVADILAEKDQEVQQLREEGEKLSLKQFELGQAIKKLRAKEKETEGVIKGLRSEIATKNLELEKLMKTFISKEGIEQSQNETISKLNQERRKLELKVEELTSELEDARDNADSMKATVENASIEILELKNVISSVQRDSAEVDRLTRDKAELITRTEALQKEVDHLRSVLNLSQSNHHSREAELKVQISQQTQKIHNLETRLADISSEVADATMPLSMEIEKLQGELKQQQFQSDRREQALQSTINDLEIKLKAALDREKSSKDAQIQLQSHHSTLELRIEELESQNRSLQALLQQKEEAFTRKLDDKMTRCQKLEKTVERLTGEVERLSNENDALSTELKTERSSFEVERRKSQTLVGQLNRANNSQSHHQHQRSNSMSTTASSSNHTATGNLSQNMRNDNSPRSRDQSPSEHSITSEASYLDEVFDQNGVMMVGNNNRSVTPKSFFESFSSAGLIESLQNQLRLKEGEAISFQEELSKNEKIRKQLNEEIANLTMQNQQITLEMERMNEMEQRLEELNKNYNAVLQVSKHRTVALMCIIMGMIMKLYFLNTIILCINMIMNDADSNSFIYNIFSIKCY